MEKAEKTKKPCVIDLFCGAGGMSEGLIQAGFHIVFSNDINEQAMSTYKNRHQQLGLIQGQNTYAHVGDIQTLTGEFIFQKIKDFANTEIDAIFGGPPCQGFSRAGQRNAEDPRNFLFKEYIRIISEIRPKYVVMENVEGLLDTKLIDFLGLSGHIYKQDNCLVPDILKNELSCIDYNVQIFILDASDYGVPQRRRRVVLIANKLGCVIPHIPKATVKQPITFIDAVGDLIRDVKLKKQFNAKKTSYQTESTLGRTPTIDGITIKNGITNNDLSFHRGIIIERFSLFNEGEKGTELRKRIQMNGIDLSNKPNLIHYCSEMLQCSTQEVIAKYKAKDLTNDLLDLLLTKKTIRTRLWSTKPSLTMLTIPDDYIHPIENRTLTVREMARLQSFDDSFEFLGKRTTGGLRRRIETPQYTQVGNAVPPLLAKAIATEIISALKT